MDSSQKETFMHPVNSENASQKTPRNSLLWFWNSLTSANQDIKEVGERKRAQITASLTLVLVVVTILGTITAVSKAILVGAAINGLISYLISRTRYFKLGAFIFIIGFSSLPYISILTGSTDSPATMIFSFIPLSLVLASALVNKWTVLLLTGMNAAAILTVATNDPKIGVTSGVISVIGVLLVILEAFRENVEKTRLTDLQLANQALLDIRSKLEERVSERTNELNRRSTQLEAAALIARSAAVETHDTKGLLDNVVYQITDRFGFYHAGIFLTDVNEQHVVLEAASSEGGKKMAERGHRLEIGRQGIVGYAAYQKRSRIAQDVGADAAFFNNPDLPETHSEVALPLIAQNRLIGVLDIQSEDRNAFSAEDVYTLQTMADQIALAIENTRLMSENESSMQQSGQQRNTQSTTQTWQQQNNQQTRGFMYSPLGVLPLKPSADEKNEAVIQAEAARSIKVPLSLRGKQIGTISLNRKSNESPWTDAEEEMADKIATQVALAVENARLLEESQRRAAREQTVNDLSSRFSRSLDVDTLLQNAVRELQRIPQVSEVSVLIAPPETTGKTKPEA